MSRMILSSVALAAVLSVTVLQPVQAQLKYNFGGIEGSAYAGPQQPKALPKALAGKPPKPGKALPSKTQLPSPAKERR